MNGMVRLTNYYLANPYNKGVYKPFTFKIIILTSCNNATEILFSGFIILYMQHRRCENHSAGVREKSGFPRFAALAFKCMKKLDYFLSLLFRCSTRLLCANINRCSSLTIYNLQFTGATHRQSVHASCSSWATGNLCTPIFSSVFLALTRYTFVIQVQEIQLTTSLDQYGIKKALQRVLERVP